MKAASICFGAVGIGRESTSADCDERVWILRTVCATAICFELWMAILLVPKALGGALDFPAYYRAGVILRTSPSRLYDRVESTPYIHPAYEALAFVPLSLLPYGTAYLAFMVLNVGLLLGIWRLLNLPWECAAFAPFPIAIVFGQDSILFITLLCAALLAARRQRYLACGLYLGLALFRFQNVLLIILLFFIWREWRVLKGIALSGAVVVLTSALIVSPVRYVTMLKEVSTTRGHGAYSQIVDRMVGLRGLIASTLPNAEWWLLPLACLATIVLCAWLGGRESLDRKLSVGVLAACLVSFHFYAHDLGVLIIPLTYFFNSGVKRMGMACFVIAGSMLALFNYRVYLVSLVTLAILGFNLLQQWRSNQARHFENQSLERARPALLGRCARQ